LEVGLNKGFDVGHIFEGPGRETNGTRGGVSFAGLLPV
jgi:hypothetical protein